MSKSILERLVVRYLRTLPSDGEMYVRGRTDRAMKPRRSSAALCAGAAIAASAVLFSSELAFATVPWPAPERNEDIVKKYDLYQTDRITVEATFSENFFRTIHKEFRYAREITDPDDIKMLLSAFSHCNANDHFWSQSRPKSGELAFYAEGKNIFRLGLAFFYYDPLFISGETCYFLYGTDYHDTFDKVFMRYLPPEFKKAKESMPSH